MTPAVKNLHAMQETGVPSLNQEDPLEEGMATHSSILAWKVPWTGEPRGYSIKDGKELDLSLNSQAQSLSLDQV